jgi:hypothetical protein
MSIVNSNRNDMLRTQLSLKLKKKKIRTHPSGFDFNDTHRGERENKRFLEE